MQAQSSMSRRAKIPRQSLLSSSSSDSDSDVPVFDFGIIQPNVCAAQPQSPPRTQFCVGSTNWAVGVLPASSTEGHVQSFSGTAAATTGELLSGENVSMDFKQTPGRDVSTCDRAAFSTTFKVVPQLEATPGPSNLNVPTRTSSASNISKLEYDAAMTATQYSPLSIQPAGVLNPGQMAPSGATNSTLLVIEPQKLSAAFISSDVHEREDSDYENENKQYFLSRSPDVSDESEESDDTETDTATMPHGDVPLNTGITPAPPDRSLFAGCPISSEESFLSTLAFASSVSLSGVGFLDLLKLTELTSPKPNKCSSSLEQILKHFEHVKTPLESYFYCNKCHRELNSLTDTCESCKDLKPSVDQVIVLSAKDQLANLYSRPGFLHDIEYRFRREKNDPTSYDDIYDGSVYRKECEEGVLQDSHNVSVMWNADGASPHDSKNIQIWPCFGVVNELPPKKRFKRENLLLFAVFIGEAKPNPNIYLKNVYPKVEALREGFEVLPDGCVEPMNVKVVWLCGTCDSPAKAIMFNQKYYNGFYSCPKCLSKGEKSDRSEDVFVHPYDNGNFIMRTITGYEEDATTAAIANIGVPKRSRISPNGIKGTTFLYLMVSSMLESTSIDSMHCVYLGVTKQFLELWFKKSHRDEQYSLYKVEKVVSNRLLSIKPPNFVKRMPSSIKDLSNWKAYDFMLMLYYYLLPALDGIMSQIYFHNFKLFVSGISILNQESVSVQDKNTAKDLLQQFVTDFQQLYSVRNMSFNIHLVLHLPIVVECLGPLWCTTCFRFEDFNKKLLSFIHGNRYIGSQIVSNLFLFLNLPQMIYKMPEGDAKNYCNSVSKKGKRVKIVECIKEEYFTVGKYLVLTSIPEWMSDLLQENQFSKVFIFHRIKIKGMLVTSETYRKGKTCSEFVRFSDQGLLKYGSVKSFVKLTMCECSKKCICSGEYFAFIMLYHDVESFTTANPPSSLNYIRKCEKSQICRIVPITSILNVCFKINFENEPLYLCDPLNRMEMYN